MHQSDKCRLMTILSQSRRQYALDLTIRVLNTLFFVNLNNFLFVLLDIVFHLRLFLSIDYICNK